MRRSIRIPDPYLHFAPVCCEVIISDIYMITIRYKVCGTTWLCLHCLLLTPVMMVELVSAKVEVTMTRRKQLGDDWTLAGDTIRLPAAGPGT